MTEKDREVWEGETHEIVKTVTKCIVTVASIGGVVYLEVQALQAGIDGVLLTAVIAVVAGLGGYELKSIIKKKE